ncbi:hypothetical protein [Brevibacterium picturae]|uniref:Uncharacterized protein n=1 Tax=Brevibacterium picturae TaxID=260553 RepID=A0ABN2B748_9MICO
MSTSPLNATVETGPPDNRGTALSAIGRAATPPVHEAADGPSLGRLTHSTLTVDPGSALIVGTPELARDVLTIRPTVAGMPGMLAEVAALPEIDLLIIDAVAFNHGPWLGADDHQSGHLAEEIFEAGRLLRARGDQTWFVPNGTRLGTKGDRVLSTCTTNLGEVSATDLEEGAAQSRLWSLLVDLATGESPQRRVGGDR